LAGALAPGVVSPSGLSALELRNQSVFLGRFQEVVNSLVNMKHLVLRGVSGGVLGGFWSLNRLQLVELELNCTFPLRIVSVL
jgi:hypothetical protein